MDKIRVKTQRRELLLSVRCVTTSQSRRLCPWCHVVQWQEPADGRNSRGSAKPPTTPAHRRCPPLHPPAAAAWAEPAPPAPPWGTVPSAAPAEPPGMDPAKPPACTWLSTAQGNGSHNRDKAHVERPRLQGCCKLSMAMSLLSCEVSDCPGRPGSWLRLFQQTRNWGPRLPPAPQGRCKPG